MSHPIISYASSLLAGITLLCLLLSRKHVLATTLVSAWWWAAVAVTGIGLVEAYKQWTVGAGNQNDIATLRYVIATATFCPMMAVLGAKRPQHNAWQLIVISLWCILVLPAAESYFVRRGGVVQIHDARGVFLWLLIGVGLINYLPTRYALTAVLIAAAQCCLLAGQLPILRGYVIEPPVQLGMALLAVGAWLAFFIGRRPQPVAPDRPWLDFFNCFGAFWGLRVAERFNALAVSQKHQVRLGWYGFEDPAAAPDRTDTLILESSAEANLDSLLLRFVDASWIRQRRSLSRAES